MWRKALRTYKFSFVLVVLVLLKTAFIFAQSISVGSVSMGSISSPKMPTIESPTIGGSFYVPGNVNNYKSKEKTSESLESKSSTDKKIAEELSSLLDDRSIPYLSAQDISAMSNMGLLSRMNTLFDDSYALKSSKDYSTDSTEKLLQKVLKELDAIKANTNPTEKANVALATKSDTNGFTSESSVTSSSRHSGKKKSHMLRFNVNGYNILNTCRTVYISDVQKDGTFLVTGDRRYLSDGKTCNETFHMLFKVSSDSTSYSGYTASSAVSQETFNPNSFMYQLTQHKNLSATRTGNLVSMRTTEDDWKLDLLIDLGAAE